MIKLNNKVSVTIEPIKPYNFKTTIFKPSHFPIETELYEEDKFYFSMNWKNSIYGIKLENKNNKILLTIFSDNKLSNNILKEITDEVIYRFNMKADISEFIQLAYNDDLLKKIEKKWHGMRPRCAYSLYELLCITLVLQNAQISRSINMIKSMLKNYGKKILFDKKELFVFWLPKELENVSDSDLRNLKIGYRAKSFLKQATFFSKNKNFEFDIRQLNKNEAEKKLLDIYGVGKASVWYLLFECFHHYDAFDYISPWENKILSKLLYNNFNTSSEKILNYAKLHWQEYRMLAIHYIFENIFWERRENNIEWLNKLIRI